MKKTENNAQCEFSALVQLLEAMEYLDTKWLKEHVDESVQYALNELSDEAHEQMFSPVNKAIEAYRNIKKFVYQN